MLSLSTARGDLASDTILTRTDRGAIWNAEVVLQLCGSYDTMLLNSLVPAFSTAPRTQLQNNQTSHAHVECMASMHDTVAQSRSVQI